MQVSQLLLLSLPESSCLDFQVYTWEALKIMGQAESQVWTIKFFLQLQPSAILPATYWSNTGSRLHLYPYKQKYYRSARRRGDIATLVCNAVRRYLSTTAAALVVFAPILFSLFSSLQKTMHEGIWCKRLLFIVQCSGNAMAFVPLSSLCRVELWDECTVTKAVIITCIYSFLYN